MSSQFLTLRRAALRASLLLLLLPLVLAGSGCGSQVQNALKVQQDLSEALQHAQVDTNDTQARQCVDRAIAVAPLDPTTYFGSNTSASDDPLHQLSVVSVFTVSGDNPAIADYMAQAIQKFPDNEQGYQILGQAQGELGRKAAQKATAVQLIPILTKKLNKPGATNIVGLTTALAQAYLDSGDTVNGIATYKKAIQAYPTDPLPLNNLAYAYAVSGTHLPEALAMATQAVALVPKQSGLTDEQIAENTAIYQDTLGWVRYQQGHYPEAEQNLLQAANTLPRLAEIRYHLGLVYIAEGNTDAARSELGHAVLLTQGYAAAQQALSGLPKAVVASN